MPEMVNSFASQLAALPLDAWTRVQTVMDIMGQNDWDASADPVIGCVARWRKRNYYVHRVHRTNYQIWYRYTNLGTLVFMILEKVEDDR